MNKITRRSFMKLFSIATLTPGIFLKAESKKEAVYNPPEVDSDIEIELPSDIWQESKRYEITAVRYDPRIYADDRFDFYGADNNDKKRMLNFIRTDRRNLQIKFKVDLIKPKKPGEIFEFSAGDPYQDGEYRIIMIKEISSKSNLQS